LEDDDMFGFYQMNRKEEEIILEEKSKNFDIKSRFL
jgi:hypothetical protein